MNNNIESMNEINYVNNQNINNDGSIEDGDDNLNNENDSILNGNNNVDENIVDNDRQSAVLESNDEIVDSVEE